MGAARRDGDHPNAGQGAQLGQAAALHARLTAALGLPGGRRSEREPAAEGRRRCRGAEAERPTFRALTAVGSWHAERLLAVFGAGTGGWQILGALLLAVCLRDAACWACDAPQLSSARQLSPAVRGWRALSKLSLRQSGRPRC